MRVQFIIPKNKSLLGHKYTPPGHPNIGIAYLGAFLKRHGHEVRVYDDGLKNGFNLEDVIKEFRPDLIGLTSFSYCYDYAIECLEEIKTNFDQQLAALGFPDEYYDLLRVRGFNVQNE